jgi:hypothetical protein
MLKGLAICTFTIMVCLEWWVHWIACTQVGAYDPLHCKVSMKAKKKPSFILEAVADYTMWLWHSCFNHPGSLNNINVWDRSLLLQEFLDGTFVEEVDFEFEINDIIFHQVR